MKLLDLIIEGVDPNITLTLQNVIKRGFANNTFEFITLARLLQVLNDNKYFSTPNPLFNPFVSTSKPLLDALRAMQPEEQVSLATKLLGTVQGSQGPDCCGGPPMDVISWMKLYNAREATD